MHTLDPDEHKDDLDEHIEKYWLKVYIDEFRYVTQERIQRTKFKALYAFRSLYIALPDITPYYIAIYRVYLYELENEESTSSKNYMHSVHYI